MPTTRLLDTKGCIINRLCAPAHHKSEMEHGRLVGGWWGGGGGWGEGERETETDRHNSNSKTVILKDSSVMSIQTTRGGGGGEGGQTGRDPDGQTERSSGQSLTFTVLNHRSKFNLDLKHSQSDELPVTSSSIINSPEDTTEKELVSGEALTMACIRKVANESVPTRLQLITVHHKCKTWLQKAESFRRYRRNKTCNDGPTHWRVIPKYPLLSHT